jgi:hypothetical protein
VGSSTLDSGDDRIRGDLSTDEHTARPASCPRYGRSDCRRIDGGVRPAPTAI